jgi:hypothetical protein
MISWAGLTLKIRAIKIKIEAFYLGLVPRFEMLKQARLDFGCPLIIKY